MRGGEGKLRDINELTRSTMTAPLWLEEDRSEDFNHGGHGRAQNSRGRRPEVIGLAMEDARGL